MDRGQDIGDNVREVATIIRFFRGNSLNSQGKRIRLRRGI